MKSHINILLFVLFALALAGSAMAANDGALPGSDQQTEPFVPTNFFNWPDPFAAATPFPNTSYFYAFDKIFVFGYIDNTDYTIDNAGGVPIHTGTLMDGDYVSFSAPVGLYRLEASDLLAVLVGAADDNIVGFHALNEQSLATGTRFLSHQYRSSSACVPRVTKPLRPARRPPSRAVSMRSGCAPPASVAHSAVRRSRGEVGSRAVVAAW